MCSRVTCKQCGKPTWSGCGAHIETVLRGVPEKKRCKCPRPQRTGLLAFLFGK